MFDQLKKWISGDANLKTEQQLQEQAKADDFLRDAREGYQSMPEADHEEAITKLKTQLQDRYKKKSSKRGGLVLSWGTIASAAAFIGAIAIFYWTQREIPRPGAIVENTTSRERKIENNNTGNTAGNTVKQLPGNSENKASEFAIEEEESPEPRTQKEAPIAYSEKLKDSKPKFKVDPSNIEAGIIEEEDLAGTDDIAMSKDEFFEAEDNVIVAEEMMEPPVLSAPTPEASKEILVESETTYAKMEQAPAPASKEDKRMVDEVSSVESSSMSEANISTYSKSLEGSVVDVNNNEAMIGVNILIKGTTDGTITDIDGRFNLNSTEVLPWTLIVSYTGFSSQEVVINDLEDDLQIVLNDEGAVLSEVVVTGYSTRSKKKTTSSISSTSEGKISPIVSEKKMKRYIRKNLEYPTSAKDQKIEGAVTVRFYINESGMPEQLSIINSLQNDCDQEAIRLLKEGPKWKPKNTWTTYTIEFKL